MLTDIERRRLQEQGLGEKWHEKTKGRDFFNILTCSCGWQINDEFFMEKHIKEKNRTFTSAQDYEDLLEKVVRLNIKAFDNFLWDTWEKVTDESEELQKMTDMEWFLTLSIEERCKLIHDFCIYMYQQGAEDFQWMKEFVGKEEV